MISTFDTLFGFIIIINKLMKIVKRYFTIYNISDKL